MIAETVNKKPLSRPPIVVAVGHVNHGKTSLLDYIRKTNFASKESGGITQSVGAYEVTHTQINADQNADKRGLNISVNQRTNQRESTSAEGRKITFIDTPGHEAFSKMRARGAAIADLAILVVSAEDGAQEQTVEAIKILKETETPFIVAITKIDKPGANIEKVKNELLAKEVLLEGLGGNVSWQLVSSKTGEGINELLELILLMGEVAELTYNPDNIATGFILESRKNGKQGVVAHIILKDGVLKEGDEIMTRTVSGRVKHMENFLSERVKSLAPSAPALVLGFLAVPEIGQEFWAAESLAEFKLPAVAVFNKPAEKFSIAPAEKKKLNVILKADTYGALEVLQRLMEPLVNINDSSVGEITDGDVRLADSTGAAIVGFKTKTSKAAENLAKIHKVKIITSEIIYELIRDFELFMKTKGAGETEGELEVLRVFSAVGKKQVVGGKVLLGDMKMGAMAQIESGGEALGQGKILNLQESKKDVKTVALGKECGLMIESDVTIKEGNKIKIYQ